jgi:hypothetical protein
MAGRIRGVGNERIGGMMGERVRTLLVVTLVAVLVWLFAESRTLRAETLTVPVEISAGGSATAFRLTDGAAWSGSLEIELAGPAGLIDGLRSRAREGIVLEIGDELPAEPGTRSLELVDAIRRADLFAESGLTIRRVSPRTLGLQTDRLETLAVPIEADLEGLQTAGPVRIVPAEATVRLPASLASSLDLHAIAKIPPARLAALTPGRRTEISQVPIELAGLPDSAWGLRLSDPRVVVTLALRVRTDSLTLREVPVRLSVLPSDLAGWIVEVPPEDRVLEDVVLTGPVSAIEQIRRGEVTPGALAAVDLAGLGEGAGDTDSAATREVAVRLIGLPSGVVADLGDRAVRVTLRRRAAAAEQTDG